MPASPIRKLVPYAEQASAAGVKIYHLNIGQPDIPTPTEMLDAVRNINFKVLEYSHSAGNESYRRKLAGYYRRNGIEVEHNDLIVTTGGSEAITFGLMSCLDADDEIIIPEPFYANYNGFAVMAGIKIIRRDIAQPISVAVATLQKQPVLWVQRIRAGGDERSRHPLRDAADLSGAVGQCGVQRCVGQPPRQRHHAQTVCLVQAGHRGRCARRRP